MTTLSVHLHAGIEKKKDKIKLLESLVGEPIAICIAPHEVGTFSKNTVNLIERILENKKAILGQRGNTNKCRFNHKYVDPWHENWCPYHPESHLSVQKQMDIMLDGMDKLSDIFHQQQEFYIAPNHLYDKNTEIAAQKIGYTYFSVLAVMPMSAWQKHLYSLAYIPEHPANKNVMTDHIYVNYDQLTKKFISEIEIESFSIYTTETVDIDLIERNKRKVIRAKKLRDIIRFLKP